jgi:hypothetical protein
MKADVHWGYLSGYVSPSVGVLLKTELRDAGIDGHCGSAEFANLHYEEPHSAECTFHERCAYDCNCCVAAAERKG